MNDFDLIIDFHKYNKRQGPGSFEDTVKALEFIEISKNKNLKVADIGCGTGGQTLDLARHIPGTITAVDLFPGFLDMLNKNAEKAGLVHKINTLAVSMEKLPFEKEQFDIIWSEGAIYNIGFEAGISKWKEYLKTGGYIAVSEITWLTSSRPDEINEFWSKEYPQIDTAAGKIKILEENGYSLAGYFPLKTSSWIDTYYKPMEKMYSSFLARHNNSVEAMAIVDEYKAEFEQYLKFKKYFSYGFYVAKKI